MSSRYAVLLAPVAAVLLAGCGRSGSETAQQPAAGGMPPAQVAVVTVHAESVPLTRDLVGRLAATRVADVRARVAGVLLKRLYTEGSDVKEGQPLFQIDPAPFQAALDATLAALAQAQANATNAHVTAQRDRELISSGLVSRSDLDNAEAAERSTAAAVQQAKANVESARINLGYARVISPISGRAGQQGATEGALVGQGTATLLTTVEQIDPIYANFDQPAIEIQRLRRMQEAGNVTIQARNKADVQLILPDGTPYGRQGTLDFRDVSVDPATGSVALRGLIPNPDHQLLPGLFVNVRLTVGTVNRAFLVPQLALQRDNNGPYVWTVGPDSKAVQKRVVADNPRGSDWIVTDGLTDGDRIVVSGIQSVKPGATVAVAQSEPREQAASGAGAQAAASPPSR